MGATWKADGFKVKANIKTDKETANGDETTFKAVLEKDHDGVRTTVAITVQTPDGKLSSQNPLGQFLMGQEYDIFAKTDQTTLPMPNEAGAKKKK